MDGGIVLDPDNYKCLWQVVLRPTNGHDGLGSDIGYGQGIDGAASNLQRRHNELDIGIQHVLTRTFGPRSWPAFGINGIPSSHFQHLLAPANSFCMWIGLIVFCLRNFHEWQMCAALVSSVAPKVPDGLGGGTEWAGSTPDGHGLPGLFLPDGVHRSSISWGSLSIPVLQHQQRRGLASTTGGPSSRRDPARRIGRSQRSPFGLQHPRPSVSHTSHHSSHRRKGKHFEAKQNDEQWVENDSAGDLGMPSRRICIDPAHVLSSLICFHWKQCKWAYCNIAGMVRKTENISHQSLKNNERVWKNAKNALVFFYCFYYCLGSISLTYLLGGWKTKLIAVKHLLCMLLCSSTRTRPYEPKQFWHFTSWRITAMTKPSRSCTRSTPIRQRITK